MSTIGIAGRLTGLLVAVHVLGVTAWASERWTEARANEWYARQGFLVGANYVPATAINELEMWQADTFDPKRIDLELGWAAAIGMNTMRVFLHDLAYQQDPEGFLRRVDTFLTIAQKHRIRPMLVLFDSVWDPFPALGPQRPPRPGVHNSGWLQSPGKVALEDPSHWPRLETYVKAVVSRFKDDARVLAWDLWNEVDNMNEPAYSSLEPKNKGELVLALLPQVFAWARAASPTQPITSGLWRGGDWSKMLDLPAIDRLQLALSDIVSFHSYDPPAQLEARITQLQTYKRPIICTEYMARGNGSTFQGSLPILKRHGVGAINWGLVQGKAQTHLPWDSWRRPYVDREPSVWFHEVFRTDGTPYDAEETILIRRLTTPSRDEGDPLARLRGGIWFVEQIQGGPIVEASRVTMTFGADGRVAGSTSCNTYSAAYAITGDRLTITMPIASLRGCEAPLMAQEAAFLTALRNLARYELSDAGVLTLHTAAGPAFVARRR